MSKLMMVKHLGMPKALYKAYLLIMLIFRPVINQSMVFKLYQPVISQRDKLSNGRVYVKIYLFCIIVEKSDPYRVIRQTF